MLLIKIAKNDKTDCSTNKREEYTFRKSVTECQNPPKENIHQKKDSNENNINKQLTEIGHNKHKIYL